MSSNHFDEPEAAALFQHRAGQPGRLPWQSYRVRVSQILVAAVLASACTPNAITTPSQPPGVSASADPVATAPPSRTAAEAAGCPVTLPAGSWVSELARVTPLPASRHSWYGDTGALAVQLPIDGVYRITTLNDELGAKIPWWLYVPGPVEITARRVDNPSVEIKTRTTAGYGDIGFNPSSVGFTSEGCWRVSGSIQKHELTFVMFVRRAAPGEDAP